MAKMSKNVQIRKSKILPSQIENDIFGNLMLIFHYGHIFKNFQKSLGPFLFWTFIFVHFQKPNLLFGKFLKMGTWVGREIQLILAYLGVLSRVLMGVRGGVHSPENG